jgi:hypothetical protein
LANELFPTSHRSTASGSRQVAATLGGVLGLLAESALYSHFGSHWHAISVLAVFALVIPFVVYAAFPETHGRRLEDISPDAPLGVASRGGGAALREESQRDP